MRRNLLLIALIGVHGVGKTYTARMLTSHGFRHKSIEVIESAYGLDPVNRQLFFFSAYVKKYLDIYREHLSIGEDNVVVDTHPLLVIPYTEYWLGQAKIQRDEIDKVVSAMLTIIRKLPKPDLLVYISPKDINTVLKRISMRKRFNISEEHSKEYVEFINIWLYKQFNNIMREVARNTLLIPAEWEGKRRAEEIVKRVNILLRR